MDITTVALIAFGALTCTVAGIGLLARDVFFGSRRAAASAGQAVEGRLRRLPPAPAATGPIARLDSWFGRLVLESGIDTTPMAVALLMVCCGLVVGGALFLVNDLPLVALVGAVLAMGLPVIYLVVRRGRRMREIRGQLADVIDLLARAVRAGESLDQAIELVGEKGAQPLATEFRRCSHQLKMGLSLAAVMRSLALRVPLMETRILATTLSVHRMSGGNLSLTLERLSAVLRERLNYWRQLRATTAAGRLSATMVASAGPLVFTYMFLFQRHYVTKLASLPVGRTLLICAVTLELLGLLWVFSMLRTED